MLGSLSIVLVVKLCGLNCIGLASAKLRVAGGLSSVALAGAERLLSLVQWSLDF